MASRGVDGHHALAISHGACERAAGVCRLGVALRACQVPPPAQQCSAPARRPVAAPLPLSTPHQSATPHCFSLRPPPADNLITGFSLPRTRYYHDVTVDALAHLSVVRDGAGVDMNLDCHRAGERGRGSRSRICAGYQGPES